MKFVKLNINTTKEEYLNIVRDNRIVNEGVRFGEDGAFPTAQVREGKWFTKIRCRMVGGPSRDNGFFFGTFFLGTLKEKEGKTRLRGLIVTEPLVHLIWLAIVVYFVIVCINLGGVSLVPIFLSLLLYAMFRPEYKKQPVLYRYLHRASRRAEKR